MRNNLVLQKEQFLRLKRKGSSGHGRVWRCPLFGAEYYALGLFQTDFTPSG